MKLKKKKKIKLKFTMKIKKFLMKILIILKIFF